MSAPLLDPQGLQAIGHGLLWVSLVATLGWAAGVVLQGARDARKHWEALEAKRRKLNYLRGYKDECTPKAVTWTLEEHGK